MIAVKFHKGQGLGNQLFCYVTTKSIAYDKKLDHCIFNIENIGAPRWNSKGLYFMDVPLNESNLNESNFVVLHEKELRLFSKDNVHDKNIGCDIRGFDKNLMKASPFTIIEGIMQDEKYFLHNKTQIKKWLKVKDEFESEEFCSKNICIINFRGGEYVNQKELFLKKKYFSDSISIMRNRNSLMRFVVITDDVFSAKNFFRDFECYHFDIAKDYVSIKNAMYLILSNSSFSYFSVLTNEVKKYVIAPKYWARHNDSNGYWATFQNIYNGWNYLDRNGEIFTYEECLKEISNNKFHR